MTLRQICQQNSRPKDRRLLTVHHKVRPVNVNSRLYSLLDGSRNGSGHATSPGSVNRFMNYVTYLQKEFIRHFLIRFVINVYEEFENVSFLLDDIKFISRFNFGNIVCVELCNVMLIDGEDTTVHEHMGPRCLWHQPVSYH